MLNYFFQIYKESLKEVNKKGLSARGANVSTLGNGAAGASYMHIARNRFYNGGTTHWGISWKQSVYEDNAATLASRRLAVTSCV